MENNNKETDQQLWERYKEEIEEFTSTVDQEVYISEATKKELADSKRMLAIAKDGLLHRALIAQTGAEPIACQWMRWAQTIAVPFMKGVEESYHQDNCSAALDCLSVAPKEE